jgi:ABC-type transport system involved in multi-copper enzyme maturation permease subunit
MQLTTLLFGSMVQEAVPLQLSDWSKYLETFAQDGGGFALLGIWFWLLVTITRSATPQFRTSRGLQFPVVILGIALVSSALYAGGWVKELFASRNVGEQIKATSAGLLDIRSYSVWGNRLMTLGGVVALAGVFVPFLFDSRRLRLRRIWALARLSFIEAVRRRVIWVFLILLLLFLFPPKWWDPTIKPEDEIRANISVIYTAATPLLLLAAALMTAFSIPADIRNQTIHTVVTKPVEKFEIVIGRFIGYLALTSLVLGAVTGFSLLMIYASRVQEEAREESMKARVPLYGQLGFMDPTNPKFQGDSVGREWDYRKYIQGGPNSPQRAVWYYSDRDLDRSLASLPSVRCEFSFDIFRTTKGEEGKTLTCTFFIVAHKATKDVLEVAKRYRELTKGLSPTARPDGTPTEVQDWQKLDEIANNLGYYEYSTKEIVDYHTDFIPIPAGLIKAALEGSPGVFEGEGRNQVPRPRMQILVRFDSRTQFLGVAKPDLYLLAAEGPFWLNFIKGAAGLWLRLLIVIGIAVTLSTYLNGVVSFLATLFLVGLGFLRSPIVSMAFVPLLIPNSPEARFNPGPSDSLRKLISGEGLGTFTDTQTATQQVTQGADDVFRWCLRRLLNVLPNMERLSWSDYVGNGFNIPLEDLGLNFVFVAGYLSLWAVLGHYLMKWREIATW